MQILMVATVLLSLVVQSCIGKLFDFRVSSIQSALVNNKTNCTSVTQLFLNRAYTYNPKIKALTSFNTLAYVDSMKLDYWHQSNHTFKGMLHCVPVLVSETLSTDKVSPNKLLNRLTTSGAVVIGTAASLTDNSNSLTSAILSGMGLIGIYETDSVLITSNQGLVSLITRLEDVKITTITKYVDDLAMAYGIIYNTPKVIEEYKADDSSNKILKIKVIRNFFEYSANDSLILEIDNVLDMIRSQSIVKIDDTRLNNSDLIRLARIIDTMLLVLTPCRSTCNKKTTITNDNVCEENCKIYSQYEKELNKLMSSWLSDSDSMMIPAPSITSDHLYRFNTNNFQNRVSSLAFLASIIKNPILSVPIRFHKTSSTMLFIAKPEAMSNSFKTARVFESINQVIIQSIPPLSIASASDSKKLSVYCAIFLLVICIIIKF